MTSDCQMNQPEYHERMEKLEKEVDLLAKKLTQLMNANSRLTSQIDTLKVQMQQRRR